MVQHLVLITSKVKPGRAGEALVLFKEMHPRIKSVTVGLNRSIFFQSIEEPDRVGCVCIWATREDFLNAANNSIYQRIVSDYFAAPIFAESPTHSAFDILFENE